MSDMTAWWGVSSGHPSTIRFIPSIGSNLERRLGTQINDPATPGAAGISAGRAPTHHDRAAGGFAAHRGRQLLRTPQRGRTALMATSSPPVGSGQGPSLGARPAEAALSMESVALREAIVLVETPPAGSGLLAVMRRRGSCGYSCSRCSRQSQAELRARPATRPRCILL